jgi:hypothetical protein
MGIRSIWWCLAYRICLHSFLNTDHKDNIKIRTAENNHVHTYVPYETNKARLIIKHNFLQDDFWTLE